MMRTDTSSEAEIAHFEVYTFPFFFVESEENVFGFQIAVADAAVMAVQCGCRWVGVERERGRDGEGEG